MGFLWVLYSPQVHNPWVTLYFKLSPTKNSNVPHQDPPTATRPLIQLRRRRHRYWLPEQAASFKSTDAESIWRQYAEVLRTSIDSCLPTSGVIGAHASGGLDSSAVFSWAHKITAPDPNRSVFGFSWHPEKPPEVSDSNGEYSLLKSLARTSGNPVAQSPIKIDTAFEVSPPRCDP